MEASILDYLWILPFIFFAGFVDSIVGGGGMITVPAYIAFGVPTSLILGTNKCVSTLGTSFSVWRYAKHRFIPWSKIVWALPFSFLGAGLGTFFSYFLSEEKMLYLLIFLLPGILFLDLKKKREKRKEWIRKKFLNKVLNGSDSENSSQENQSLLKNLLSSYTVRSLFIGLSIGFYDGFFGPGTGVFFLFSLSYFLDMNYKTAIAGGRVLNYLSNLGAFGFFIVQGRIFWELSLLAGIFAILGNLLGSYMVIRSSERWIEILFYLVLSGLLAKSVWEVFL